MKRSKNIEEKPVKGVKYSEIKPNKGLLIDRVKYMLFLDIYHDIRPYLNRPITVKKEDLIKKYPENKKLVLEIWECAVDLKLEWVEDYIGRIDLD